VFRVPLFEKIRFQMEYLI